MAVNVNSFKNFVEYVANKNQQGNSVTPSQFSLIANRAQMVKFEADRNVFIETKELTKYLTFFLKNIVKQVPLSGNLIYPADWQHTVSVRSYFVRKKWNPVTGKYEATSVEVEVKESKDKSWGNVQISSLLKPIPRFPKYLEFAEEYRFLPKNIGTVYIDYLKTPIAPVWGFTILPNGRTQYDPAISVDFEFEDFSTNEVAAIYLSLIGVNLKDSELSAFSQAFKQESKAPL